MTDKTGTFSTPEDLMVVSPDAPKGFPTDAMYIALLRAKAIGLLLFNQFEDDSHPRLSNEWMLNSLFALEGELNLLETMIDHGVKSESMEATT